MIKLFGRFGITTFAATAVAAALVTTGNADPVPTPAVAARPLLSPARAPSDIEIGKTLFTGTCGAYCHRPSSSEPGDAVTDAPSLFDCDWIHGGSDAQIFNTITKGVEGTRMVAFGGAIPDEDIWRIIGYLKSASKCNAAS